MPFNTIEGGRWDNLIRRLFSMKQDAVAPSVGTDIVPVANVQPWRPEMAFLKGEQLAFGSDVVAAVAGQFAMCALINPVGSGVIGMIEKIYVRPSAFNEVAFRWTNTVAGMGVATDQAPRDTRWARGGGAGNQQACQMRGQAIAVVPGSGSFWFAFHGPNAPDAPVLDLPFVLTPGNSFIAFLTVANVTLRCAYLWREREATPAELLV